MSAALLAEGENVCLVADIGGTHARFALARQVPGGRIELQDRRVLLVREHAGLEEALCTYLESIGGPAVARAVLAVAGAVVGDEVVLTNSRWRFSVEALRRDHGLRRLEVVNDFEAVAWAVPQLGPADLTPVGTSPPPPGRGTTRVVLGPGTGLGVAAIRGDGVGAMVLASEGGHVGFAPHDEEEQGILRRMQARYGRVSCERLLCGEGLVNLYWALGAPTVAMPETPEAVVRAARGGEARAMAAVRRFCMILGGFAGDVALMYGGWRGVYLAGGLLPHVLDGEGAALFRARFEDKGRFAALLADTPVFHIVRPDVGDLGAGVLGLAPRLPDSV